MTPKENSSVRPSQGFDQKELTNESFASHKPLALALATALGVPHTQIYERYWSNTYNILA